MKGTFNIAVNLAPKDYKGFCKWIKLAAPNDPLTADERWVEMGNKLPDDNKRTKKSK